MTPAKADPSAADSVSKVPPSHRVLITGCGRSGTKYIAGVLQGLGLDVPHEDLGADGAAVWTMVVDSVTAPSGVGRRGLRFGTIIHQVRHPLRVIPSVTTFKRRSWAFIEQHIDCPASDPPLIRAAKYWALWNERAERLAEWTYRVEQLPAVFDEFCRRVGVPADPSVLDRVSTKVNSRRGMLLRQVQRLFDKYELALPTRVLHVLYNERASYVRMPFTWGELETHAPEWSERIKAQARRYGYTEADDAGAAYATPTSQG